MLKAKMSQTINAGSFVTENGVEVQVASMYASLDDEGNRNDNCTIINQELYIKHLEAVEADISKFRAMASALKNSN